MIGHFYHAWANGAWEQPLTEHVAAMCDAGFGAELRLGVIGSPGNCKTVCRRLDELLPGQWSLAVQRPEGFEEVTLMAARTWAARNDGHVLYMHDKGSYTNTGFEAEWRRRVTTALVGGWELCTASLDAGSDAVGCHWLHPGQDWPRPWPDKPDHLVSVSHPHFSGNFWWATTAYLRTLPGWPFRPAHYDGCCAPGVVPQARGKTNGRWLAELWIGMGNPRVHDLCPGLPGEEACA